MPIPKRDLCRILHPRDKRAWLPVSSPHNVVNFEISKPLSDA
ncbi:MAG: hypothetical protein ACJATF_002279 [Flavobacteriales bacterium]